jgi:hypothetical protein
MASLLAGNPKFVDAKVAKEEQERSQRKSGLEVEK